MAELAMVALTKVGVSAAAAKTIGTIASVGMTAASAFSSISAGRQEAASLKLQSRQSLVNAKLERQEGRRKALEITDRLNSDLASQNALFSARGQLTGEGSAQAARSKSIENASRDIDLARFDSEIAGLNAEQRASNARSDAKAAKKKGIFDAIDTVASYKRPSLVG